MDLKNDRQEQETKRPYEPPRILAREKLEVLAGPCAKQAGNAGCSAGPLSS